PRLQGHYAASDKSQERRGGDESAAQIVQHLPPTESRKRFLSEDPGQQLPVATRPAMLASCRNVVARGKIVDDLDIGGKPGAGKRALEEIVAEESILRNPSGECRLEGIDVIDALAGIGTFAEQVLIDVGDGRSIRIDAAGRGKDPLVQRAFSPDRKRRCDTRLDDCITVDHAL